MAFCSELGDSRTIGESCLHALAPGEASVGRLTQAILASIQPSARGCSSEKALANAIRESSRDDFRARRIVSVDGWMLSVTETRVYALAASLSRPGRGTA